MSIFLVQFIRQNLEIAVAHLLDLLLRILFATRTTETKSRVKHTLIWHT